MASIASVSAASRPQFQVSAQAPAAPRAQGGPMAVLDQYVNGNMEDKLKGLSSLGRIGNAGQIAIKGGAEGLGSAQGLLTALKGFDLTGAFGAAKALGQTALSWGTKSAGIQGGLSLVVNGYRALNKKISYAEAGSRVVGDTASGFVGGMAGTAAAAVGTAALGMFGVAGGMLTLGGAALGMAGFFVGEKMFKESDIYRKIKRKTKEILSFGFKPLAV